MKEVEKGIVEKLSEIKCLYLTDEYYAENVIDIYHCASVMLGKVNNFGYGSILKIAEAIYEIKINRVQNVAVYQDKYTGCLFMRVEDVGVTYEMPENAAVKLATLSQSIVGTRDVSDIVEFIIKDIVKNNVNKVKPLIGID